MQTRRIAPPPRVAQYTRCTARPGTFRRHGRPAERLRRARALRRGRVAAPRRRPLPPAGLLVARQRPGRWTARALLVRGRGAVVRAAQPWPAKPVGGAASDSFGTPAGSSHAARRPTRGAAHAAARTAAR